MQDTMTAEPGQCSLARINATSEFTRYASDYRLPIGGNVLLWFMDAVEVEKGKEADYMLVPFTDLVKLARVGRPQMVL